MFSIGLHTRLVGRPGRAAALARFLDYARGFPKVWFARRIDIARHWVANQPPADGYNPARMSRALFMQLFGGVYEHSKWIAEAAFDGPRSLDFGTTTGLSSAMAVIVDRAPREKQLALINAHPDLSGKLAQAKLLTPESTEEQASAGLDQLTVEERDRFMQLNEAYRAKFGIVFIMAVRGASKQAILEAFERRLSHTTEQEFAEALMQIHKIARLRIEQILVR